MNTMTEREIIEEIKLVVKNAIADNSDIDVVYDCVQTDDNGVDHIAEEIAEKLIEQGYRKADEVRKETAREILQRLFYKRDLYGEATKYEIRLEMYNFEELCERYGVEVEE